MFNVKYEPLYYLADSADSITLAIENVYPNAKRLVCWAHVERAISDRLRHLNDGGEILKDIYKLQISYSKLNFECKTNLFFAKWDPNNLRENEEKETDSVETKFFRYFKKEWIVSKHSCWYEGAGLTYPSTNNALESTNKTIKDKHTLREREHISRFMNTIFEIIEKWSFDRSSDVDRLKTFSDLPSISTQLWEKTGQYIESKPIIKYLTDFDMYLISDNEKNEDSFDLAYEMIVCETECCDCYKDHYDFDQFTQLNLFVRRVKLNKDKWQLSTCTCIDYLKFYICEHIICLSVKFKLAKIDFSFNNIGMKKKRGRKPKAKDWYVKH